MIFPGLQLSHGTLRRGNESSEIVHRSPAQTITRGTDPINTVNQPSSNSFQITRLNEPRTSGDRTGNLEIGRTENSDRHGSASQTLSDLAAAASNRLMAENAAEIAAGRQTARSVLSGDSNNSDMTYSDRPGLLGALRSSRDPFFGTGFGPPISRNTGLNINISHSAVPSNQWATSEEMEVIQQSQLHQLRGLRSFHDPRSPPPLPSDVQGISGHDEEGTHLRDYNSSFSHSPESSFVEVVGGSGMQLEIRN